MSEVSQEPISRILKEGRIIGAREPQSQKRESQGARESWKESLPESIGSYTTTMVKYKNHSGRVFVTL